jgi:hypothetical protein
MPSCNATDRVYAQPERVPTSDEFRLEMKVLEKIKRLEKLDNVGIDY